jgi:hypothetical protein
MTSPTTDRQPLGTFKLDKSPSEMTDEELDTFADMIPDQWSAGVSVTGDPSTKNTHPPAPLLGYPDRRAH